MAPLYRSDGTTVVGVASIDVTLIDLNNFLKSVKIARHGTSYMMDMYGYLLASSSSIAYDPTNDDPDFYGRLHALNSTDASIRLPSTYLYKRYGNLTAAFAGGDSLYTYMSIAGATSYVLYRRLRYEVDRVDWIIVIVIPESDVLGKIFTANWITLGVSAAIVVTSVAYSLLLVLVLLVLPLRRLSSALRRVAKMDLDSLSSNKLMLYEMAKIEQSFVRMIFALKSFGKFVPSAVISLAMTEATVSDLRLRKRTVTVFFSDIEDFTKYTETLSAKDLLLVMGRSMEELTRVLTERHGTVDKFIGDAIMCLFNAPTDVAEHEYHACVAALRCRRRMHALRRHWRRRGLPPLRLRIGLHTGTVLIGNFGSSSRLNYTALGDVVNMAARCEPLCKVYGTRTLVTGEERKQKKKE